MCWNKVSKLSFVFLLKFFLICFILFMKIIMVISDSYQYFKDAQFIFHEFNQSPKALLSIISSIGYSDIEYEQVLRKTAFWFKEFDHGLYNDNRTLIRINVILVYFHLAIIRFI